MEDGFKIWQREDGLRLCSYTSSRFKTACISVNAAAPLSGAVEARALLPYILSASSRKYPDYTRLNRKTASLYGASLSPLVLKLGDAQLLQLSMNILDNRFAFSKEEDISLEAAELLSELLFNPDTIGQAFKAESLGREKQLMLERIAALRNDKRSYAMLRLVEEMFEGESYAVNKYGSEERLKELDGRQLFSAYGELLEEGLLSINIIGNTEGLKEADALLCGFERSKGQPKLKTEIKAAAGKLKRVRERLPVTQGKLALGFRLGVSSEKELLDRSAALELAVDIFGGGTYSRLFRNVREKLSLCYYCSAGILKNKGAAVVQCGVENDRAEAAENEILEQLRTMTKVSEKDRKEALLSLTDKYNSVCDAPESIDAFLTAQAASESIETPSERIRRLSKVCTADIEEAAAGITLDTIYFLEGEGEKA